MHVLITADTLGGVWTYTRELTSGLLARGHKVTLVSFGKIPGTSQACWLNHRNLAYYPTSFPLEWMRDANAGIAESARHLTSIISQNQPDILHFNQFCYGALECGIPKVVVAHSDVVSWWNAVHETEPPRSAWIEGYTTLVSRGLRCADAVVAPSQWMLHTLSEHYELPDQRYVIYNGRSAGIFRSCGQKTDCVLSVGRIWDEAKQVRLLLARKHLVPIRIAGSAEHPDSLPTGTHFESNGRFQFWGEQDEAHLCELYSDSATYAATSRYEPFGLAPVEAALSRCALIANDIPVFRELWGDSAFYFQRNDPDSLADAISILSRNALLREGFAEQAYERARSQFNSVRMVTEYEDLYRALTKHGARK